MPHLRLSRLLPATLLVIAVHVALRLRSYANGTNIQLPLQSTPPAPEDADAPSSLSENGYAYENYPWSVPHLGYARHIVAVGDLHADYENALKTLYMAGVVDTDGHWAGGADLFVQTGDIIDRGTDTIKLFNWMEQLRAQAQAVGGDVVTHLGNHEWMNLLADWRYVYPEEILTFGSIPERQRELTKGRIGQAWAANYSITSRIPLHPPLGPGTPFPTAPASHAIAGRTSVSFDTPPLPSSSNDSTPKSQLTRAALSFVHGGLAPHYAYLTPYPERINALGRTLLKRLQARQMPDPHPPAPYQGLPRDASSAERSLYNAEGPLWYRGWAQLQDSEKACQEVNEVLERVGVRRLVMGHTPNFENIASHCDGKIIVIDTGISRAYGGVLSALSVNYTLTPVEGKHRRWYEREVVTALYPDRQEVLVVEEREIESEV